MKHFYAAAAIAICFAAQSQNVVFSDAYLKTRLMTYGNVAHNAAGDDYSGAADTDNNGEISLAEAAAVTGLDLRRFLSSSGPFITSADGLENFVNLKNLRISGNQLTSLDVSMMPSLEMLSCSINQLTSLNVEGLAQAKEISCANNQLASLSLGGLSALESLHCYDNQFTALDLSNIKYCLASVGLFFGVAAAERYPSKTG